MKKLLALLLLYFLLLSPVRAQEKTEHKLGPPEEILSAIEKARAEANEARLKAQPVIASTNKALETLELELQKVEEESIRAMKVKEDLAVKKGGEWALALASQVEEATKEKVKLLNERLQILRERLKVENELLKEKDRTVAILERRSKLTKEVETIPLEKAVTAQKEIEVAEAYLQAAEAKIKEKEANLEGLKEKLKEVQKKTEEEMVQIQKNLKALENLPFRQEEGPQQFVRQRKLLDQTRLYNANTKVAIAEEKMNLAEEELERAKIDFANAQLEVALLKDRASLLGEKLKAKELKKKEEEVELAKKAEEEKKKRAEIEKAVVEREKEEALRKAEELTKEQLAAVSPEEKRVLELESLIVALKGETAKKKDTLITEGTRLFEDITDYKKLDKDIQTILGGENTPAEIAEEMSLLKKENTRWQEKLKAVGSLLEAAQKEKTLLTEKLEQARSELVAPNGEIPKIMKEAETFQDKVLASKLTAFAQERVKLLEEQEKLVAAVVARIEERELFIQEGLKLLTDAMKELSEIKTSNIWARREWRTGWLAMKEGLAKLLAPKKPSDLGTAIKKPTEKKLRFLLSIVGILSLIAAAIFGSYYCVKWCRLNLKKLEEAEGKGG